MLMDGEADLACHGTIGDLVVHLEEEEAGWTRMSPVRISLSSQHQWCPPRPGRGDLWPPRCSQGRPSE